MIGTQKFHIIPKLSWQNIYNRDCGEPMIITLNKIANLYIYIKLLWGIKNNNLWRIMCMPRRSLGQDVLQDLLSLAWARCIEKC